MSGVRLSHTCETSIAKRTEAVRTAAVLDFVFQSLSKTRLRPVSNSLIASTSVARYQSILRSPMNGTQLNACGSLEISIGQTPQNTISATVAQAAADIAVLRSRTDANKAAPATAPARSATLGTVEA